MSTAPLTLCQGPDDLVVSSLPDAQPAPDQYVVTVHAAAANFFDILQIQGKYQTQPRALNPGVDALSLHEQAY